MWPPLEGLADGKPEDTNYDDPTAIITGTWNADQEAWAVVHTVNQNANRIPGRGKS